MVSQPWELMVLLAPRRPCRASISTPIYTPRRPAETPTIHSSCIAANDMSANETVSVYVSFHVLSEVDEPALDPFRAVGRH